VEQKRSPATAQPTATMSQSLAKSNLGAVVGNVEEDNNQTKLFKTKTVAKPNATCCTRPTKIKQPNCPEQL
jgi:hypothetical protein